MNVLLNKVGRKDLPSSRYVQRSSDNHFMLKQGLASCYLEMVSVPTMFLDAFTLSPLYGPEICVFVIQ